MLVTYCWYVFGSSLYYSLQSVYTTSIIIYFKYLEKQNGTMSTHFQITDKS